MSESTESTGARAFNPWLVYEGLFIPNWLLVRPELTLTAKVLLVAVDQESTKEKRPADARLLLQRLGVPHSQATALIRELEHKELLVRGDQDQGWWASLPAEWADPTYERGSDGVPVYASHEPGQWWMGNESLVISEGEDEGKEEQDEAELDQEELDQAELDQAGQDKEEQGKEEQDKEKQDKERQGMDRDGEGTP